MRKKRFLEISNDTIHSKIYLIRGRKVMLDSDLAELYEVETKNLTRQVRRNKDHFPEDFMFQLSQEEFLRCQIGVGLIKSVDDSCCCSLISFLIESIKLGSD